MRSTFTRRRRIVAGLAATAVPAALLALAPAADAANPTGSNYELFFETNLTGDPANKIVGGGRWGHEGASHLEATTVSGDLTDGGAALAAAFGGNTDNFALVFVPTSANGSAEEPTVTAGQTVADAYPYFTEIGFATAMQGASNPSNDQVLLVSTAAEWADWTADGKPSQIASSNDLVLHDAVRPGAPVSAHPKGKSILNRWAAGQNMSAVIVKTTGAFVNGIPVIDASTGHAEAAWVPFTTAVDPAIGTTSGIATSGAYNFAVAPATTTTTSLAVTETSPQLETATLHLTATVSPAAAGTVTFKDGSTTVGSAPVSGGSAAITASLPAGSHNLTAAFAPADTAAYAASTSSAVPFTTTATPAVATTTVVSIPAGAIASGDSVPVTASVTPTSAVGAVQFKADGVNFGSPVPLVSGVASTSWTAVGGGHNISAAFIPANPAAFTPSTSSAQLATVSYPANQPVPDEQTIVADVDAGAITISTPYTPTNPLVVDGDPSTPLVADPLKLNPTNTMYTGSAAFEHIIVTDTRAGGLPWTLTALAGALSEPLGGTINGQNVGLTNLAEQPGTSGVGVLTATDVQAANAVAASDAGALGLGGTAGHEVLRRAAPGTGTVEYKGLLTIQAPTSTQAATTRAP